MSIMNLWDVELTAHYRELLDMYADPELPEDQIELVEQQLVEIDKIFAQRVGKLYKISDNMSVLAAAKRARVQKLEAQARTLEERHKRLDKRIVKMIDAAKVVDRVVKIDDELIIRAATNSMPTMTTDFDKTDEKAIRKLPVRYVKKTVTTTYSIDYNALVKDWRAGKKLPRGIKLEKNSHLREV